MDRDITFINAILLISLLFVFWELIQIIQYRGKYKSTDAIVMSTIYANPNGTTFRNSKWALVSYRVDGKSYISKRRIQVAMNTNVGDKVKIKFEKEAPERIVSFSYKKLLIGLMITIIFCITKVVLSV